MAEMATNAASAASPVEVPPATLQVPPACAYDAGGKEQDVPQLCHVEKLPGMGDAGQDGRGRRILIRLQISRKRDRRQSSRIGLQLRWPAIRIVGVRVATETRPCNDVCGSAGRNGGQAFASVPLQRGPPGLRV